MFEIGDLEFDVSSALLDAFFEEHPTRLAWGIEIIGTTPNESHKQWKPKATAETLLRTRPGELKNWKSISGKNVSWRSEYDEEGEIHGFLYIFDHCPIYNSKCNFERVDEELKIKWTFQTDVNWKRKYEKGVNVRIDTGINFYGIWCGKEPKAECFKLLNKFFNPEEFRYVQTEHGVSLLKPS